MSSLESSKGPLSADETQQSNCRETVDADVADPHRSKNINGSEDVRRFRATLDKLTEEDMEEDMEERAKERATLDKLIQEDREERAKERAEHNAEMHRMIHEQVEKAFEEDRQRRRRKDALWNRKSILQAARNEFEGKEAQADLLADAFKQEVMNLQWTVAERGPRVEELLSNPQARDLFTPDNFNTLFGALDKHPKDVKAEILSDILTLEQAQINSWGGDVDGPEAKETRTLIRELLVFWGPRLAMEYWDVVVGNPEEFNPIDEDQVKRFNDLLE